MELSTTTSLPARRGLCTPQGSGATSPQSRGANAVCIYIKKKRGWEGWDREQRHLFQATKTPASSFHICSLKSGPLLKYTTID